MKEDNKNSMRSISNFIKQTILSLILGIIAFVFIFFMAISLFQLKFNKRIFPGVHINNTHVGGKSPSEAAILLTQAYQFSDSGLLTLKYLDETILVTPEQIGISLDAVATSINAYQFGRSYPISKWLFHQALIFSPHIKLSPVVIFDKQIASEFLNKLANEWDQPLAEASLTISGTQVASIPGQNGHTLDIESSINNIQVQLLRPSLSTIPLIVKESLPTLPDANEFIPLAQEVLDHPFLIELPDDGFPQQNWTINPTDLTAMLDFKITDNEEKKILPQMIQGSLDDLLVSIAGQVNIDPENPRFVFNDDTLELDLLSPGKKGRTLSLQQSGDDIQRALTQGVHSVALSFNYQSPEVSDSSTARDLDISELIHSESSYFYGSDQSRIQNIEIAANQFYGLLVAPGETFSMADAMDEISLDNGYSEALIIFNGKTIEGIGGGVCQVSTTLFRAAFFSGFPITERHPHAYRVSYYEKTSGNNRDSNLAGLDATVYIPIVDLKFTNDTPYWLLMETYISKPGNRLTWKFYSTYDGRTTNWTTTGPTNIIKPKDPLYQLNEDLDAGEIKQVDWEAQGADVTVSRNVTRDSKLLFQDTFFTRYEPWRSIYEYGPGTEGIPTENSN
jgi:vancomycin resistance protein YoaR